MSVGKVFGVHRQEEGILLDPSVESRYESVEELLTARPFVDCQFGHTSTLEQ